SLLSERRWVDRAQVALPDSIVDDEKYPEVVIIAPPVAVPKGRRYRPIRKAINKYKNSCDYVVMDTPVGGIEPDFIMLRSARAGQFDDHEESFNRTLINSLGVFSRGDTRYHYLFRGAELVGLAITGNTTGVTHGYYLGALNCPGLSTYLHWQ